MAIYDPRRPTNHVHSYKTAMSAFQAHSSSDPDSNEDAHNMNKTGSSLGQYNSLSNHSRETSRSQADREQQQYEREIDHYDNARDNSELPPLQLNGVIAEAELEPLTEDDPRSYDLVQPVQSAGGRESFSIEKRSQALFSRDHLQIIFADSSYLLKFTSFLGVHRPDSVALLVHFLDCLKALRAIHYANAIATGLDPVDLPFTEFTQQPVKPITNTALETRAAAAFDILVKEELPAFITHQYLSVVSTSIASRITGSLAPHLREASEGLAEVFCLTDPSRHDNPIVFASEEFNRTTQYGMSYVLGRNCRFLQGPWTNPLSVRRLRDAIAAGKQHQEVFLNYRRDGSPFMNLLMIAPLCDSRGQIRYFIGAQVDVSGLVKECSELESLARLLELQESGEEVPDWKVPNPEKNDELRELSEMLNSIELSTVRKYGGRMHRDAHDEDDESVVSSQPRLLLKDPTTLMPSDGSATGPNGRLSGVYQHYLLVRPYPSLRILFASPSLRVPGILQSPFMNKIGGSNRVRDELTSALAEGRGVTAKVRWVSMTNANDEGRNRWIHCTPLVGSNGQVGVWMVVIVDDPKDRENEQRGGNGRGEGRRYGRLAPQIPPAQNMNAMRERSKTPNAMMIGSGNAARRRRSNASIHQDDGTSIRNGEIRNGMANGMVYGHTIDPLAMHGNGNGNVYHREGSIGSPSVTSLRID